MPDDLHHPTRLITVTDATFHRDVKDHSITRPVLVDFWAPWCAPCKALKPVLEELASHMDHMITFAMINVDENYRSAEICEVRAMPTLVLWHKGTIVANRVGAASASALRDWLTNSMN